MNARSLLRRLARNDRGAAAVETAIVAPVLLMLSLGGFEASSIVARQSELQSAAAEALQIAQAITPDSASDRESIRNVLKSSTGITDDSKVTVDQIYRCGTNASFVTDKGSCGSDAVSTYIKIDLDDTYTPLWTKFGIGSAVNYHVERTVQIS